MRQKLVKWMTVATALFSAFLLSTTVLAEENAWEIWIEQVTTIEDGCEVAINQRNSPKGGPKASESTVSIDGKDYEIGSIDQKKGEKYANAYLCLADISGSMDEARMEQVRAFLAQLAETKSQKDVINIVSVGNGLDASGFLKKKKKITNRINELKVTSEDTNLYYAIEEGIKELSERSEDTKAMLIFSDGVDEQMDGITREEAQEKVRNSGIPVYTVALLKEQQTESELEGAKILGSFARYSEGGLHYVPVLEGKDISDICKDVKKDLGKNLVLTLKASDLPAGVSEYAMEVSLSDGKSSASDTASVEASEFSKLQIQEKEEVDAFTMSMYGWVIISAAVALLLLLLVIMISRRSKQRKKIRTMLFLTRLRDDEIIEGAITDELKIGRSDRCQIQIPEDEALSEFHCGFLYDGVTMKVKDEDSTNGTYVNGVPISGEYEVQQNDVLLIGSDEYTINWGSAD